MTVEQALVYLLAAVAGIFLFFGLAQALEGRHAVPRRPRSRPHGADVSRPGNGDPSPPALDGDAPAPPGIALAAGHHGAIPTAWAPSENGHASVTSPHAAAARAGASTEPALATDTPGAQLTLVEDAMRLCLAGNHEQLERDVAPRLSDPSLSPHAAAALWCLVGMARPADAGGRRAAFAASVQLVDGATPGAAPPRLAAQSVPVARRLLDLVPRGDDGPGDAGGADDRLAAARLAARWLTWRLDAVPDDGDAATLLDGAREAMADAHARQATAAIARQEYGAARALLERAVEGGELSGPPATMLFDLLGAELRREIDRLTAAAIRGGHDDGHAVGGLDRAEALLGALPDGAIGAAHRAAVAQRIWRGRSKLGFRRLRLGQLDAAADTLFHALAMRGIGRRRQRQVRDALVRTLEGLGDQRVTQVASLVAAGQHPVAADEVTRLERRIERARDEGVSDEELQVASAKVARLRQQLTRIAE
jgi:hypothetical protein